MAEEREFLFSFFGFFFFFFMWNLSFPTRDRISTEFPRVRSTESQPLDHQGSLRERVSKIGEMDLAVAP